MDNPYQILGVSPTATSDEIRKAYRALAMRHHPDRNPDSDTVARFNAIQKAYDLLSDPKARAAYNQSLSNRILVEPLQEARTLWQAVFERCGVSLPTHHS